MTHLSRHAFVTALAAVPFALGCPSDAEPSGAYVCPPCGCGSDFVTFPGPGRCPSCGMTLVAKGSPDAALPTVWAGAYGIGETLTPIRLAIKNGSGGPSASFDLAGFDGGYPVKSFVSRADELSGTVEAFDRTIAFEATVREDRADGSATIGQQRLPLALQRIAPLDIAAARRWEGAYRSGARLILVEHIFGDILQLHEQPDGPARILFPLAGGDYVFGPALFAPAPQSFRVRFDEGNGGRMILEGDGPAIVADKLPLRSEPFTFKNGAISLGGTLVLPAEGGRRPAFVFTHGSGAATRTTFSGLGYYLAAHGFAVLKYDKRGSGESTGNGTASFEDLADDAAAGADALRAHPRIGSRIGYWGLSQGSSIAPLAAARHDRNAPVIAASGGGIPIDRWELLEGKGQLESDGRFSSADVAQAMEFETLRDRYKLTRTGWDEYAAARAVAVTKPWYGYPTSVLFGPRTPDSPLWNSEMAFYFYDGRPALRVLRGAFLGLMGEYDPPSASRENLDGLRESLARNPDVTIRVLPRAGHSLFENASPNARELPKSRRHVPGLFATIAAWAQRTTSHA